MRSISQGLIAASSLAALLALGACGQRETPIEQRVGSAADRTEQRSNQAAGDVRQESRNAGTNVMGAGSAMIDDAQIVTKVNAGLAADKDLSALQINVDSKNGDVTLKGTVPNSTAKQRAENIAKNVKDVKTVDNQISVTG